MVFLESLYNRTYTLGSCIQSAILSMIVQRFILFTLLLLFRAAVFSSEEPPSFGLGSTPSNQEIEAWNTDVRPDGQGLPKGNGNGVQGKLIYQQQCQACHGVNGSGGPNDQLVGRNKQDEFPFALAKAPKKTIGNYWPWTTTVFDYIKRTMPYTTPGSLTDNEVYAVTAYLLSANGIIPENFELNATTLPEIKMPSQKRFTPDNRLNSTQVR